MSESVFWSGSWQVIHDDPRVFITQYLGDTPLYLRFTIFPNRLFKVVGDTRCVKLIEENFGG